MITEIFPKMCTLSQIRNLNTSSRELPVKSALKIGISAFLWICPLLAPFYGGIQLLYAVPIGLAERHVVFVPNFIQMGILFVVTAIITGLTQIKMMRHFATSAASRDPSHDRTRALVDKAMKTAALQFLSASCFQVIEKLFFR